MSPRNLAKTFHVSAAQTDGDRHEMAVTMTWDSATAMEFRLHIPMAGEDGTTLIVSVARDLLVEVCAGAEGLKYGIGDVSVVRTTGSTLIYLDSQHIHVGLFFPSEPLAAFVRTSLSMCPIEGHGTPNKPDESEVFAATVDAAIQQIFKSAEGAQ